MHTLGRRIQAAVNDYGIGGYVLDLYGDCDRNEISILTPIYGSDGHPVLAEDGEDIARVLWVVPMDSTQP